MVRGSLNIFFPSSTKMKQEKVFLSAGLLLSVGVFVFGLSCSKKNDQTEDKITLTFWHSFVAATIPSFEELIRKFEADHADIKIKAQYVPTGAESVCGSNELGARPATDGLSPCRNQSQTLA